MIKNEFVYAKSTMTCRDDRGVEDKDLASDVDEGKNNCDDNLLSHRSRSASSSKASCSKDCAFHKEQDFDDRSSSAAQRPSKTTEVKGSHCVPISCDGS